MLKRVFCILCCGLLLLTGCNSKSNVVTNPVVPEGLPNISDNSDEADDSAAFDEIDEIKETDAFEDTDEFASNTVSDTDKDEQIKAPKKESGPAPSDEPEKEEIPSTPAPVPAPAPNLPATPSTPDETPSKPDSSVVVFEPLSECTHADGECDLSEYATDLRTTTEHEQYETERFFVDVEAGCTVPANLDAHLDKLIKYTEDVTGLSLDSEYGKSQFDDKVTIYIVKDIDAPIRGDALYLYHQSTFFYDGNCAYPIQRIAQMLLLRNGPKLNRILESGYTTYITKIAGENMYLPYLYHADMIYGSFSQPITADNAETLFLTLSDWETNLYAYAFSNYLHAQYGETIYPNLLQAAQKAAGTDAEMSNEQAAALLKSVTQETVFEDFATWYNANLAQFEVRYAVTDMSPYSRLYLDSSYDGSTEFYVDFLHITDSLTLDLGLWRECSAIQQNIISHTLEGSIRITGSATLEFYNSNGDLIQSSSVTDTYQEFSLQDVETIRAVGSDFILNAEFTYYPSSETGSEGFPIPSPFPGEESGGEDNSGGGETEGGETEGGGETENVPFVTFTPITEVHTGGKCDLSEYVAGTRYVTEHEYYETERFFVDIAAGSVVPTNLDALLDQGIRFAESATEWSLDASYGQARYGNKITFYISDEFDAAGYGAGIYLHSYDTFLYEGNMFVLIHELTHCLEQRQGPYLGQVLTEGHSTYVSKINRDQAYLPYFFDADANYSCYEQEITADNAETLFLTLSDWDAYMYGYRLSSYLHAQYGPDIYHKIIEKTLAEETPGENFTQEQLAAILKSVTEENVFVNFATWYQANIDQFSNYLPDPVNTSRFSRIILFPTFMDSVIFSSNRLYVQDFVNVDLSVWRDYQFKQFGQNVQNLQGTVTVIGTGTVDFYDSQGTLLQSFNGTDQIFDVTLTDVNSIQITGTDIIFSYDFTYSE